MFESALIMRPQICLRSHLDVVRVLYGYCYCRVGYGVQTSADAMPPASGYPNPFFKEDSIIFGSIL